MKKIILMICLILTAISVSAADFVYTDPYSDTFTTESELGLTLEEIRTAMSTESCYIPTYWQSKSCDYLYYCYAVLPSDSNDIGDALIRDCTIVNELDTVTLEIKDFLPPKGVLYYVVTFVSNVDYVYDENIEDWKPIKPSTIPTEYIRADSIRNICPEGQMLSFNPSAGKYQCYIAERACLDTLYTGLCTNPYNLWVLDKDTGCGIEDGTVSEGELQCGSNYCADRPLPSFPNGDGICDLVVDLGCVDICTQFDLTGTCVTSGANGLCDEWDMASLYGCWDDVLSANSKICDTLDVEGCFKTYNPVCVGGRGGTTYPNSCFAEKGQSFPACPDETPASDCYIYGACEPDIVQCYDPSDCPDLSVCLGGSTAGISKMCLNYMCSYNGACGNLACSEDIDCSGMTMPCVGVYSKCDTGVCTIAGSCLTPPEPQKFNLWDIIQSGWVTFWNWIKGLFGA